MGKVVDGSYGGPGVGRTGYANGPGAWPYGGPGRPSVVTRPDGPDGVAARPTAPRRRRALLAAVALLVVAALAAAGVAVAQSHRGTAPGTTPASSGGSGGSVAAAAPDDQQVYTPIRAQVASLFAARAAALRSGDLRAWLKSVDPQQPALAASETTLFTNLRQLPLTSYAWDYDTTTQVSGLPVPNALLSTLGVDEKHVYVPGMRVLYELRGFDQQPVADDYAPVLVERSGTWYLAGDRTRAATFDESYDEPWSAGPVKVRVTAHSLVVVSPQDAGKLAAMAAQADAAVAAVASFWPSGWSHKVVVYASRDSDVFASYLGRTRQAADASGLTLGVGKDRSSRAREDLRVVLNPMYSLPGTARIPELFRHEFTHVAQWAGQALGTPRWVIEGIAQYTAFRNHLSDARVLNSIGTDARKHRMPRTMPDSATFYGGEPAQEYHYDMSWLAWEYMSQKYGEGRLKKLYDALAAITDPPDSPAALKKEGAAFVSVLHVAEPTFVHNLQTWTAKVIRPA